MVHPNVSKYCNTGTTVVVVTDSAPALQHLISIIVTAIFLDTAHISCSRPTGLSGVSMTSAGIASEREQLATNFEAYDTSLARRVSLINFVTYPFSASSSAACSGAMPPQRRPTARRRTSSFTLSSFQFGARRTLHPFGIGGKRQLDCPGPGLPLAHCPGFLIKTASN